MNKQTSLKAALLISLLASAPVSAQTSERADGMRFVPDVPGQFRALTERADAIGFHISTTPNPSSCKHYQAITRVDGADGTPFFLVTRSGNTPSIDNLPDDLVCDDSPGETGNGHLIVFRMDSREKHGERMRSNRLRKGGARRRYSAACRGQGHDLLHGRGRHPVRPGPCETPGTRSQRR